ncbi:hypothetical protein NS277_04955 [Novosphingobium barchaimii]|nr:hypothetical protein NS277_04955 [Novosphingobium barchaimii]
MKQIIETVAAQVPTYAAIAREIVEYRLKDFEGRILDRFDQDRSAKTEAFKDPDFQYLLRSAQHSYARSGDEDVGKALADLIVERSKISDRSRLSLTLNQAVEVASALTVNEFAELAFCFLFSRTKDPQANSLVTFNKMLNEQINPYIDQISQSQASYAYLEAQRCANNGMMVSTFRNLLINNYSGLLAKGFSREEISNQCSALPLDNINLVIPALRDPSRLQLNSANEEVWKDVCATHKVDDQTRQAAWSVMQNSFMNQDEIISELKTSVPRIADAFNAWDNTPIKGLQLTSVGIAIGHSYATSSGYEAPLSVWIN